ncbi:MAG: TRAP transporter TatT component family protein [Acidobacteriota bacterium]
MSTRHSSRPCPHFWLVVTLWVGSLALTGCSVQKMAVGALGDALAGGGADVFASDPDPDLVGDALPFAIKTIEALLAVDPENVDLRLTACSTFTQYAYAFVELPAEHVEPDDYRAAKAGRERAVRLYLRGRDHCFAALDLIEPGTSTRLPLEPEAAVERFDREHVPLLYWTAGAWGSAISSGLDRPEIVVDLPAVEALLRRAVALEPSWGDGTLHDAMLAFESVPESMGGSTERARYHYEQAVRLSGDTRVGSHLSWAWLVCIPRQDRAGFEQAVERALAVPIEGEGAAEGDTLANTVNRDFVLFLRDQADELFLEPLDAEAIEPEPLDTESDR